MPHEKEHNGITRSVYHYGEQNSGILGPVQNFEELKEHCAQRNELFRDPVFVAHEMEYGGSPVIWKRPQDIVQNPEFITDSMSRFDVNQGRLGDCWFIAAVADITIRLDELKFVVPEDNGNFDDDDYSGIFHFRFWHDGEWIDVSVDDLLPTLDGQLLFLRSKDLSEFWPALLEKAYAKIYGSYEILQGGLMTESLQDMTGGVTSHMKLLAFDPVATFERMYDAINHRSFIGAATIVANQDDRNILPNGLVIGHAYSVIDMNWVDAKVSDSDTPNRVPIVCLRNPWGRVEWNGDWSDRSDLWNLVSAATRKRLRLEDREDGEFWMSFGDFINNFNLVEICDIRYPPKTNELQNTSGGNWDVTIYHGQWESGVNAGGCRAFKDSFYTNPKYSFTVNDIRGSRYASRRVTVALLHKGRRALRLTGENPPRIGFVIYKMNDDESGMKMVPEFFERRRSYACSLQFDFFRENSLEFDAEPGNYLIMPCTRQPNQEGKFLLRIFVELDRPASSNKFVGIDKKSFDQHLSKVPTLASLNNCEVSLHLDEINRQLERRMSGGDNRNQRLQADEEDEEPEEPAIPKKRRRRNN